MRGSRTAVGLLLLLPAVAAAGPIQVRLDARLTTPAGNDWVTRSLAAVTQDGPTPVNPAGPTLVSLLNIAPPDLPSDTPGSPHQGTATYYKSDYFTLNVRLTDYASGESGELSYTGRLHAEYRYAGNDTWTPSAYIWLGAAAQNIGLGDNLYTLSPPGGHYAHTAGQFEVWVGGNAPQPLPEPGTLALAALGLPPVAVWFRRRRIGFPS